MGLLIRKTGGVKFTGDKQFKSEAPVNIVGDLTVTGAVNAGTTNVVADGAITAAKLATDAVETLKIKDLNVTTGKLAALAVTAAKLAADAVTTAKILDANVTTAKLAAGAGTLPKLDLTTGLKVLAADGLNTTGGDAQVTLTGTAVGDRVVAIFGHVKANTGAHTFLIPTLATHFEAVITVQNKIVQKQAAGDLSANTYVFILAPAAA